MPESSKLTDLRHQEADASAALDVAAENVRQAQAAKEKAFIAWRVASKRLADALFRQKLK
jgi:hypothetical protein